MKKPKYIGKTLEILYILGIAILLFYPFSQNGYGYNSLSIFLLLMTAFFLVYAIWYHFSSIYRLLHKGERKEVVLCKFERIKKDSLHYRAVYQFVGDTKTMQSFKLYYYKRIHSQSRWLHKKQYVYTLKDFPFVQEERFKMPYKFTVLMILILLVVLNQCVLCIKDILEISTI